MKANIFIPSHDARNRYGRDLRTLKEWARKGYILYQVINPESRQPEWLFESPEARYDRVNGNL